MFCYSDVWLLTTGLNKGASNVVGRSLYRRRLLYKQASKPVVIGLNSWCMLSESTWDELIEVRNVYTVRISMPYVFLEIGS